MAVVTISEYIVFIGQTFMLLNVSVSEAFCKDYTSIFTFREVTKALQVLSSTDPKTSWLGQILVENMYFLE